MSRICTILPRERVEYEVVSEEVKESGGKGDCGVGKIYFKITRFLSNFAFLGKSDCSPCTALPVVPVTSPEGILEGATAS